MPLLRTIESRAYPREYHLFKGGYLKALLSQEGTDEFSFIITTPDGTEDNKAVGYCVASYGRTEADQVDTNRVRLHNFAVLPEYQKTGIALAGFSELMERAAANDISVVDAYARDTTSYPLIMRGRHLIEAAYGYRVHEIPENNDDVFGNWLPNESGLFDSESEDDHHIALVRVL